MGTSTRTKNMVRIRRIIYIIRDERLQQSQCSDTPRHMRGYKVFYNLMREYKSRKRIIEQK